MFVIDSQTESYWNNKANEFSVSMSLRPVLSLFLKLNRQYFQNSLLDRGMPRVSFRWSDGRMRAMAGLYKRKTNFFYSICCYLNFWKISLLRCSLVGLKALNSRDELI